jgi:methylmalonyl-CoA mutase cobalamin-binding subunit
MERCGSVHLRLERGRQLLERGSVGAPCARRRHHPGAQLANHLLSNLGLLVEVAGIEPSEREAAGLAALAVACGAVLAD